MSRIGCLGDSNTCLGDPLAPIAPSWVDYAAELAPEHAWRNFALGGSCVTAPITAGWPWGLSQLAAARADGCDTVIAAFGTNDFRVLNKTRDEVINGYCALVNAEPPLRVIVATTPWCTDRPDVQDRIGALNTRLLLLQKHAGWTLLDFDSGDLVDLLVDGVHMGEAGQRERARRAVALIRGL